MPTIETFAGTGEAGYAGDGGEARAARLNQPFGVIVGPGRDVFFCDTFNHVIRKIGRESGVITTVAGNGRAGFSGDGGPAVQAEMHQPHSIQFDGAGERLLICDIGNHRIRAVTLADGVITTWCGNGQPGPTPDGAVAGPDVPLQGPRALDIAPNGDLWLVLREGNAVYRIDARTRRLEHVAGTGEKGFTGNGGPAKAATLSGPKGVAVPPDGRRIYLADTESHTVRAVDLACEPPVMRLVAGDGERGDGPDSPAPTACRMARLHGLGVDAETGDLYIGDSETHKVRVVRTRA